MINDVVVVVVVVVVDDDDDDDDDDDKVWYLVFSYMVLKLGVCRNNS